jgi:UDP-N-acetylmuramoyl-L-alanyl-D-glutamate--2,6-diaminopimelate ligase
MTIRFPSVSGRCETIYSGKYRVIRDYAHTPDGIEKILSALLPLAKNRLIVLFGATGERDKGKRPEMGEIAARYADYLVITTDNPANEPPEDTIHQVEYGVIPSGKPYDTFVDRGEAIRRVVDIANTGDIIALLGKGHETYQTIGNEKTHFDEKEIVLDILKHKNNL